MINVITAKSQNLLRTIVENYIAEGQPVASARLAAAESRQAGPAPHRLRELYVRPVRLAC